MQQFLAADGAPHAFYRVPPDTSTLLGFLRGLTESLEKVTPGAHLSLAMAHERAMQAPSPSAELALWLGEHLREAPVSIAIDDLHNASDSVPDFLSRAVAAAPQGVRWLIATREMTTFPVGPWLARGEIDWPIEAEELRFTAQEIAELARCSDRARSPAILNRIMELTGGWPSAVGLALSAPEILAAIPASLPRASVYDALAAFVFDRHDEETKKLLLKTAVFSEFDRKILEVAGWSSASVMSALAQDSAFVDCQSDERFRFDNLFRSFLLERLRQCGSEVEREALVEAGAACERIGRLSEALSFYTRAGTPAPATRILSSNGFALMDEGAADIVEAAIAGLDDDEGAGAPIMALKAVLDAQRARFDSAEAWFQLAINESADETLRANITYRYALDLLRRGRLDCIELLEGTIRTAPADHELYPLLCSTLATAYVLVDRFDDARRLIGEAMASLGETLPDALRARAFHQAAYVALRCADIPQTRTYAERVLKMAIEGGFYDLAARTHSILYEVAHAWEANPRQALEHVERVAAYALKSGDTHVRQWALLAAYYIEAERGNGAMMSTIERSLNAAEVLQTTEETTAALLPGQALRATWSGDFAHAYRLLTQTAEGQVSADRRALRWAEIALFGAAAGFADESRLAVGAAERELGEARSGKHSVQALSYSLVALSLLGDDMSWLTFHSKAPVTFQSPGLAMLVRSAEILRGHWSQKRDAGGVLSAMDALRGHDLGGIASMLEALPAGTISPTRSAG